MWLGTNRVNAGKIVEFRVPPNARARMEASPRQLRIDFVTGAVAVPNGFNLIKPRPMLVVSVPSGGSSIKALARYTNTVLNLGWVLVAGEGPRVAVEHDTVQWGWGMLSSVLDYIALSWPQTKSWPVACAGFSGGAKRSGTVAAAMMKEGYSITGLFMGGCNEDRASLGLQLYKPGERFKQVPIFLSNGSTDPIAGPQQAALVAESMRRSGFRQIRLESYQGGHQQDDEQLALALEWFRQLAAPR